MSLSLISSQAGAPRYAYRDEECTAIQKYWSIARAPVQFSPVRSVHKLIVVSFPSLIRNPISFLPAPDTVSGLPAPFEILAGWSLWMAAAQHWPREWSSSRRERFLFSDFLYFYFMYSILPFCYCQIIPIPVVVAMLKGRAGSF
jgi:hypothetical protein